MKKIKIFIVTMFLCLVSLFACDKNKKITVEEIQINNEGKEEFALGENVELSNIKIIVKYSDDTKDTITFDNSMWQKEQYDFTTCGEKEIELKFKSKDNILTKLITIEILKNNNVVEVENAIDSKTLTIDEVIEKYNSLTEIEKKNVSNYDKLISNYKKEIRNNLFNYINISDYSLEDQVAINNKFTNLNDELASLNTIETLETYETNFKNELNGFVTALEKRKQQEIANVNELLKEIKIEDYYSEEWMTIEQKKETIKQFINSKTTINEIPTYDVNHLSIQEIFLIDTKISKDLENRIANLNDNATLSDLSEIEEIRVAYNRLSIKNKNRINNLSKLEEAETEVAFLDLNSYKQLKKLSIESYVDIDNYHTDKITMINAIVNEYKEKIDALTSQEAIDSCFSEFETKIKEIPLKAIYVFLKTVDDIIEITLDSESKLVEARNKYTDLSNEEKQDSQVIEKLELLKEYEQRLELLKYQNDKIFGLDNLYNSSLYNETRIEMIIIKKQEIADTILTKTTQNDIELLINEFQEYIEGVPNVFDDKLINVEKELTIGYLDTTYIKDAKSRVLNEANGVNIGIINGTSITIYTYTYVIEGSSIINDSKVIGKIEENIITIYGNSYSGDEDGFGYFDIESVNNIISVTKELTRETPVSEYNTITKYTSRINTIIGEARERLEGVPTEIERVENEKVEDIQELENKLDLSQYLNKKINETDSDTHRNLVLNQYNEYMEDIERSTTLRELRQNYTQAYFYLMQEKWSYEITVSMNKILEQYNQYMNGEISKEYLEVGKARRHENARYNTMNISENTISEKAIYKIENEKIYVLIEYLLNDDSNLIKIENGEDIYLINITGKSVSSNINLSVDSVMSNDLKVKANYINETIEVDGSDFLIKLLLKDESNNLINGNVLVKTALNNEEIIFNLKIENGMIYINPYLTKTLLFEQEKAKELTLLVVYQEKYISMNINLKENINIYTKKVDAKEQINDYYNSLIENSQKYSSDDLELLESIKNTSINNMDGSTSIEEVDTKKNQGINNLKSVKWTININSKLFENALDELENNLAETNLNNLGTVDSNTYIKLGKIKDSSFNELFIDNNSIEANEQLTIEYNNKTYQTKIYYLVNDELYLSSFAYIKYLKDEIIVNVGNTNFVINSSITNSNLISSIETMNAYDNYTPTITRTNNVIHIDTPIYNYDYKFNLSNAYNNYINYNDKIVIEKNSNSYLLKANNETAFVFENETEIKNMSIYSRNNNFKNVMNVQIEFDCFVGNIYEEIKIDKLPSKLEYWENEEIDFAGLTIKGVKEDLTELSLNEDEYEIIYTPIGDIENRTILTIQIKSKILQVSQYFNVIYNPLLINIKINNNDINYVGFQNNQYVYNYNLTDDRIDFAFIKEKEDYLIMYNGESINSSLSVNYNLIEFNFIIYNDESEIGNILVLVPSEHYTESITMNDENATLVKRNEYDLYLDTIGETNNFIFNVCEGCIVELYDENNEEISKENVQLYVGYNKFGFKVKNSDSLVIEEAIINVYVMDDIFTNMKINDMTITSEIMELNENDNYIISLENEFSCDSYDVLENNISIINNSNIMLISEETNVVVVIIKDNITYKMKLKIKIIN